MIANLETFSTSYAPTGKGIVTGMGAGDFDFLTGDWHIRHKRLKDGIKDVWQTFESSATVHPERQEWAGRGNAHEVFAADAAPHPRSA